MVTHVRSITTTALVLLGVAFGSSRIQPLLAAVTPSKSSTTQPVRKLETSACGDQFEPATRAEERAFLSLVSGIWRDGLGPAEARGQTGLAEQEGLIVEKKSLALARVRVRAQVSEGFDAFVAVGPGRVDPSKRLRVGRPDRDGFRFVEASFKDAGREFCLVYRLKANRLSDDREALLVKGPTVRALAGTKVPKSLRESNDETARVFVR